MTEAYRGVSMDRGVSMAEAYLGQRCIYGRGLSGPEVYL